MAGLLIVEDEAIVALDLASQIQEMGHKVLGIADNAAEAIRLARDKLPDLVLMDVVIKGDRDGVEAGQVIQNELYIPVVFLTAYSDTRTVDRLTQVGPSGYLTKPFLARELKSAIQLAVYKGQMEASLRESRQWMSSALACVSDGVIASDEFGEVRFMNPVAERLTGWSSQRAQGRPLREVLQIDAGSPALATVNGRGASAAQAMLLSPGGRTLPVEWVTTPVSGDRGQPLGDITTFRVVARP